MPSSERPPLPDYIPEPEYPEYLVPSDDEEDLEEDLADYPADRGDDDDGDDDDDDGEDEEENLAPADSTTLPTVDPVPLAEDTKALETDEFAPTPTHTSHIYVEAPLAATEALIAVVAATLPSSPPPSLLTLLSSLISQILSPPLPLPSPPLPLPTPLSPLLLPATNHREDFIEADVPPRKRLCLTAPAPRFEVRESSVAAAARQPGLDDDMIRDIEGRAPTTLEELSKRVTDLAATLSRDTHEMYVRLEDAQDDRALQRARFNSLFRDRVVHAELLAYRAEVRALNEQISVLQRQRTKDQRAREPQPTRDPGPQDGPTDDGSSC
ncbi:hypothetical protein Tco_0366814 [Tanacetum coccineum]